MLHDGQPVATWRARKKGSTLQVELAPLTGIPPPSADPAVEAEAARLAAHRGCATAAVTRT